MDAGGCWPYPNNRHGNILPNRIYVRANKNIKNKTEILVARYGNDDGAGDISNFQSVGPSD